MAIAMSSVMPEQKTNAATPRTVARSVLAKYDEGFCEVLDSVEMDDGSTVFAVGPSSSTYAYLELYSRTCRIGV